MQLSRHAHRTKVAVVVHSLLRMRNIGKVLHMCEGEASLFPARPVPPLVEPITVSYGRSSPRWLGTLRNTHSRFELSFTRPRASPSDLMEALDVQLPPSVLPNSRFRGVAKLEAFSQRVGQAAGRLQMLGTLLQHKEAGLVGMIRLCCNGSGLLDCSSSRHVCTGCCAIR